MARVRFVGPDPVLVPELGNRTVDPDQLVTVPDERYWGYICQPSLWEGVEEPPGFVHPDSAEAAEPGGDPSGPERPVPGEAAPQESAAPAAPSGRRPAAKTRKED